MLTICCSELDDTDMPGEGFRGADWPIYSGGYSPFAYNADCYFEVREDDEKATNLPHMAIAVCESTRQSPETLVSEIVSALSMLLYRLRYGKFVDHHTLPVSVPTGSTVV